MTVPAQLVIGHRTYSIVLDSTTVESEQPDGMEWGAFSDPRRQLIGVRDDSGPDDERDSVLHEVLHQCLRASGCWPGQIRPGRDVDLEEVIISAMTGPLLRALRDNPDLVTYLVQDDGNTPR